MNTLCVLGHIHLATKFATGAIGHEGRIRGEVEREHPTLLALCLSLGGSSLASRIGQSVEIGLVCDMQGIGLVFLEQVLRELQTQHASLLSELTQAFLSFLVEQGTTAHKAVVTVVEQALLLLRQQTMVTVYVLHTPKEFFVEAHIIGMLREDGLHLLCQGVHLVVGLGTQQIEEDG